ncbi:hypothetical protein BJL95_05775 [Methylomonas sp. LWB]|nr:hypothetical protein BJL95_05775 [Methylomonas sp. LWB]
MERIDDKSYFSFIHSFLDFWTFRLESIERLIFLVGWKNGLPITKIKPLFELSVIVWGTN